MIARGAPALCKPDGSSREQEFCLFMRHQNRPPEIRVEQDKFSRNAPNVRDPQRRRLQFKGKCEGRPAMSGELRVTEQAHQKQS